MAAIVENEPVYILHRRPYRESSYILDVFSINYGRLSLVANGAGKTAVKKGQNLAAILQSFQPLVLSWSGRSSLKTLRSAEATAVPFSYGTERLYCAYYLSELVLYLTPEADAFPELFAHYGQALERLASESTDKQLVLRVFEYHVLSAMGLLPSFDIDVQGMDIAKDRAYLLNLEEGFFPSMLSYHEQREQQPDLAVYEGRTIINLANNTEMDASLWSKDELRQLKYLMKCFVDSALHGRALKSRSMYEQLMLNRK